MQSKLAESGAKFYYVDSYGPLADMIAGFHKYGEPIISPAYQLGFIQIYLFFFFNNYYFETIDFFQV